LAAQKLAAWREVAKRVAHEIKNPLTPIQLSIQRIYRKSKRGAADLNDAIASAHDTIMGETHLLKNLVDEFSTFAKMPAPVKTRLDVTDLIKNVVESYAKVYSDREIQADFPAENVHLQADPSQIRQVLSNLINNAAQATQEGDAIRVRLIPQPETLVLEVSDEGTGIPDVEKAKVFLPYYSKSPKGTGLGLAIVKRIVNDHGGTIVVLDNHPKGTCFRLEFPTKNEHSVKH
jgi:two-component system nitrogen regulation sensor histidine kinase NtrY